MQLNICLSDTESIKLILIFKLLQFFSDDLQLPQPNKNYSHQNTINEKQPFGGISLKNSKNQILKVSKFKEVTHPPLQTKISFFNNFARVHAEPSVAKLKAIKLIEQIILLQKIAKNFKYRTKFRKLDNFSSEKVELINDSAHFPGPKASNHYFKEFTSKNVA